MTIVEYNSFRAFIDKFLILIKFEEKHISSKKESRRKKASKVLEVVLPRLKFLTQFYIKKFCKEPAIANNRAYLNAMKVDVIERVREHVDVELPKVYAKLLRCTKK